MNVIETLLHYLPLLSLVSIYLLGILVKNSIFIRKIYEIKYAKEIAIMNRKPPKEGILYETR